MNPGCDDNQDEYSDPPNYDAEYTEAAAGRIRFYGELAERSGPTALEIGCGTGLVTIPAAARGVAMTGVDLSSGMLAWAREKARRAAVAVEWIQCDVRQLQLARRFHCIYMAANTFQAFLDRLSQGQLLQAVRKHILDGGTFAFDTRNPSGNDLTSFSTEEHWGEYVDATGQRVVVSGTQWFDDQTRVMHWTTYRRWVEQRGQEHTRVSRIACRFTAVDELNELLAVHGFEVQRQLGDWNGASVTPGSERIITVCTTR